MTHLNRSTLPAGHLIGASAPETTGIVGVANRSHRVTDAMASQDFLYSAVTLDPGKEEVGVVDVHRRTLVAAEDAAEALKAIADPRHKIVTLTISEVGYHLDAATGQLEIASPRGGSSTVATTI